MKTLNQYIKNLQEANEEKVYVVKDKDDNFLNVFNTKEEAEEEAKRWNEESKANGAKVSEEKKSDYEKK